jgi:transposase
MAKKRIGMRKIREVLRLGYEHRLSMNKIAPCCNMGRTTVQEYFRRFKAAGLTWPLPEEITDEVLENRLFPPGTKGRGKEPLNYQYLLEEIKKPDVTLALLWEEYKQTQPEGYQYSRFCELFRGYQKTLNYTLRQEHKAGEKTFVDLGSGLNLVDPKTGEFIPTSLFVSVWGASDFTFAKAALAEDIANWIDLNISALEYFGCCPKAIIPDNLKAAVNKACRYDPEINPTYAEFARHYGVVILPARPNHPKDKAKAENGIKLVKRWILAKLRNRIFYSLAEMNEAIRELLDLFNNKAMKRLKKSRKELFETLDKPHALPLPQIRYELAEWKKVTVNIDYHISFDDHYYSVPYTFVQQELEIRATSKIVEIFKKEKRIDSYPRSYEKYQYTTKPEHMPKSHQQYLEWTPTRILEWAGKSGQFVKVLVEKIIKSGKYPELAYRRCLGIIRLGNRYSSERLNQACRRALEYRIESYQGVKNILLKNLDQLAKEREKEKTVYLEHENIRGGQYYQGVAEASLVPTKIELVANPGEG